MNKVEKQLIQGSLLGTDAVSKCYNQESDHQARPTGRQQQSKHCAGLSMPPTMSLDTAIELPRDNLTTGGLFAFPAPKGQRQ